MAWDGKATARTLYIKKKKKKTLYKNIANFILVDS